MEEISNFCMDCPSNMCCPEQECVLFRIEQIVQEEQNTIDKAINYIEIIDNNESYGVKEKDYTNLLDILNGGKNE